VEILPLKSVGDRLYFVNVLEVLDCLDEEKTDYRLSLVTQTKVGINKYAFKPEKIADKHIFKRKKLRINTFLNLKMINLVFLFPIGLEQFVRNTNCKPWILASVIWFGIRNNTQQYA